MAERQTKRVAILIEQHVEDSEFQIPYTALQRAGAEVTVLGSRVNETYAGKQAKVSIKADATTTDARAADFDAVVIPGGMAPDKMRTNMKTVRFVRDAVEQGKLVAAVCHGPQVLIEADVLRGKRATGFRAIRKDMQNAGANFENEALVVDGQLLTARRPSDVPVFTAAIIRRLGLELKDVSLPEEGVAYDDWWQLAEEWGGSTKDEIVDGLNTAIRGERYALTAFEHYATKATAPDIKSLFNEIVASKQGHVALLVRGEVDLDLVEDGGRRRVGESVGQVEGVHHAGLEVAERAPQQGHVVARLEPALEGRPRARAARLQVLLAADGREPRFEQRDVALLRGDDLVEE